MGFSLSGLEQPSLNPLDIYGFEPGSAKTVPELTQVQKDFELSTGKKLFSEPWRYKPRYTTYGIINGKEIKDLNNEWKNFKKAADILEESKELYNNLDQDKGPNGVDSGGFTEQELIDAASDPTKTIVRDADGNVISIDDISSVATDPGGTLGEVTTGTGTDTTVEEPITTIDENINNDSNIDFTGNGESGTIGTIGTGGTGGTLNEAASPGFEIIGNVIYDANGNIIGTTGETAPGIAPVVGGASPTNPVFDEISAEQQAEMDRNAEAVALLDSGYGRYNAAIRKMGVIGRQGEEYAPLILDQLRMAEQEAAQPQFAAFGFGQNNMLGGMPQIGVQGVQGNTGGQSALSALSNAGLNQLNVGRQNYNRIALPDVGADGMPVSQVNNPTIFKASTNV